MPFLTSIKLKKMGFASIGQNVLISDKASIHNAGKVFIGNDVRIDDFCVVSAGDGGVYIGNNIHIAVFSSLIGAGKIQLSDFCNISSRVSIYSSNDDYSGEYMTNPTVPDAYKNVTVADVYIGRHVIVGSGAVILPGVTIAEGAAIGALSLVNQDCGEFKIYSGIPIRLIKERKKNILNLEHDYRTTN
ncbi:acyltransferase [Pseudidiomarina mangrovi]|uniref:acyltransferase n=1 Tax=Pseudidiomarina mangrovi TaxID=2487133 RepID=UPI000FCA4D6A|nr:acyltransferase [Pseudidiomarina mangrovi]